MHAMQSTIISEIVQCIDTGEFNKIGSVDRKGSVCSLITIIIFLCISLRITQKKLELKHNQTLAAEVKDHAAKAQRSVASNPEGHN